MPVVAILAFILIIAKLLGHIALSWWFLIPLLLLGDLLFFGLIVLIFGGAILSFIGFRR